MTASKEVLVLWDVDRTLVSIDGVSRAIYERAFSLVTGKPLGPLAPMAGRTDRAILTETLKLNGIDAADALFADFYTALGMATRELAGQIRKSGKVLPGVPEAIAALDGHRTVQSVATGNIQSIAKTKLGAVSLTSGLDFEVGGYGDDGSDRADLVRCARERASAKYGSAFVGKRTFVVGDTPHDIKGAHDAGAYAIGVATGASSLEDLTKAGADLALADLTQTELLRDAVLGAPNN